MKVYYVHPSAVYQLVISSYSAFPNIYDLSQNRKQTKQEKGDRAESVMTSTEAQTS